MRGEEEGVHAHGAPSRVGAQRRQRLAGAFARRSWRRTWWRWKEIRAQEREEKGGKERHERKRNHVLTDEGHTCVRTTATCRT